VAEPLVQPQPRAELQARLEGLLHSFAQQPSAARSEVRALLQAQPAEFCALAVQLLPGLPEDSPARQFLCNLLLGFDALPKILSDPAALSPSAATELIRLLSHADPMLDAKLTRWLLRGLGTHPDPAAADPVRINRLLEILESVSDGTRTVVNLVQLLRHPSPKVRSKAALMVGRSLKSGAWAEQRLLETDARVRANVVEALWGLEAPGAADVFKLALRDSNNRVVGNALVGLYLLGDPAAATLLQEMAAHRSAAFRATAAWAMGFLEDPQFLPVLGRLLKDREAIVRRNVLRSLARIKRATGQGLPAGSGGEQVESAPQEPPGTAA